MGIPVNLNGVSVGMALVDQGASRSVMRLSAYLQYRQTHGTDAPKLKRIHNTCVMGSTGDKLPVIGCFTATLTYCSFTDAQLNDTLIGLTPIYIVNDTDMLDIICNLIIGRSTIAASQYA